MAASKGNTGAEFNFEKPVYNSTFRLIKKLDELRTNKPKIDLSETEIEKINEKASAKLNLNKPVFEGLISVEPDEEDFLKYLEIKNKTSVKPQIKMKPINQQMPELMELYPTDLITEFSHLDMKMPKDEELKVSKAWSFLTNDPIRNYYNWN